MDLQLLFGVVALAACGGSAKAPPPAVTPVNTAYVVAPPRKPDAPPPSTAGGPYDYRTWTAQLDDERQIERSVDELDQLGNPAAIPALGHAWQEQGRPARILQVIIALARPLTPQQAEERFFTDYAKTGRAASWAVALPYLLEAMDHVDGANPRSVDSAMRAAEAIGVAKLAGGLDGCASLALRPVESSLLAAQVAAAGALGQLDSERARAALALVTIVERSAPNPPSGEPYLLHQALTVAAVNALAELRSPAAVPALVTGMYRAPALAEQYRRALIATGPTAKDALVKVLRGTNAAVNQLTTSRPPTGAREYYAALVLGDFYDPAVVPDLLRVLKQPARPSSYVAGVPSSVTQWHAVFDALRKLGSPTAARALEAVWVTKPTYDTALLHAQAIEAYAYVVRGKGTIAKLGAIAADNAAIDEVRVAAAHTVALVSRSASDNAAFKVLANKYLAAAKGKATEGAALKASADAAEAALAVRKQKLDDAKVALLALANAPKATTAAIKQGTQNVAQLEVDWRTEKEHRAAVVAPYRETQQLVAAYTSFARMFLTHIARVEVGMRCGDDAKCLVATLDETVSGARQKLAPLMKDVDDKLETWTADELAGLVAANVERGMIELGKQGPATAAFTDALLDHVATTNRTSRAAILLALPKIAKLPCLECGAKLDAAIAAAEGQVTLADLTEQTRLLRSYFR